MDNVLLTTHMPFHAAIKVAIPMKKPMAERALQPRPAELRVRNTAQRRPPEMPPTPRLRAKRTRGGLPLQIVYRIKLGCAWCRRVHSTVPTTSRNAEGCVVTDKARSSLADSLSERFRHRAPSVAMYVAMMRETSSLYGWTVTRCHE